MVSHSMASLHGMPAVEVLVCTIKTLGLRHKPVLWWLLERVVIVGGGGSVFVFSAFFCWSWIPQFRRLISRIDPLLLEHGVSPSS